MNFNYFSRLQNLTGGRAFWEGVSLIKFPHVDIIIRESASKKAVQKKVQIQVQHDGKSKTMDPKPRARIG
jgi:hypothetical protein